MAESKNSILVLGLCDTSNLWGQPPLGPSLLPEPSHPSIYPMPLPTQPKPRICLISTLAWRQLCWITHTYAIIHAHPLPQSTSTIVLLIASLGGCYRCLSSLNVEFSYIEIRDYSSTTMTAPLLTKITNGTNDLANTPIDASMNLNICSTLNNSSQNARPSPKFKILPDESALACWSVEGWKFRFHTTANVNIDVDPVSDRVLGLRLNAPSSSPAPYVQLSTAPCEHSLDNPPRARWGRTTFGA